MIVKISWKEGNEVLDLPNDENQFYQQVAKKIATLPVPNAVTVACSLGNVSYQLTKRSGTMFIREEKNSISFADGTYPSCYLVCVNPEHNNYKFYQLEQNGDDIVASYGRIGAKKGELYGMRSYVYPRSMYWVKYYEKVEKGYEDKSDLYLAKKKSSKKEKLDLSNPSDKLYDQLLTYAKGYVEHHLENVLVTEAMVKESRKILKQLYQKKTVSAFNRWLLRLLAISPRKVAKVDLLLAKSSADFLGIIDREENLVAAMDALVSKTTGSNKGFGFANIGIEIYEATDSQKEQVLRHLDVSLQGKVKNIYRTIPKKQQKAFDAYLQRNQITKVKQFWHGSRNENWLSIMKNSLSLNPNAVITGKMFGDGIYFAPKSTKSWNYTSFRGTYWAKGTSNTGYMGLYATAYGEAEDVYVRKVYSKESLKKLGKNCVHAHAGSCLINDEIIFFDEAAMVLNYIVEFGD